MMKIINAKFNHTQKSLRKNRNIQEKNNSISNANFMPSNKKSELVSKNLSFGARSYFEAGNVYATPQDVKRLEGIITSRISSEERADAINDLCVIGKNIEKYAPAALKLFHTLRFDNDENVKYNSAKCIGELGVANDELAESALISLKDYIKDRYSSVKSVATKYNGEIGEKNQKLAASALKSVKIASNDTDSDAKAYAARSIGKIGAANETLADDALSSLNRLITRDNDSHVKSCSASSIGKIGAANNKLAKNALESLNNLLPDKDSNVRVCVAKGIGTIGVANETLANDSLMSLNKLLNDRDGDVRDSVARSIGKVAVANESLADDALSSLELLIKNDNNNESKTEEVESISNIGSANRNSAQRSLNLLKPLVNSSNDETADTAITGMYNICEANKHLALGVLRFFARSANPDRSGEVKTKFNNVMEGLEALSTKANELNQAPLIEKIDNLLAPPKKEPAYKKNLERYADVKSVLGNKAEEAPFKNNEKKVANLYDKFAENTLQTLAQPASARGSKFTQYWVGNKKLGNKNLTDFWLSTLGRDSKAMTSEQKLNKINSLSVADKKTLIKATATEYTQNVLPVELNRLNNNDLGELDESKNINTDTIRNMLKTGDYQNKKIGDKPILDFWIDTVEGEGESGEYPTQRMKQSKVAQLIEDDANADKIVKETIKASGKTNTLVQTAQNAYKDIIDNDPDFNEAQKSLLKDYQNSKLFFYVVTDKVKNQKDILKIEGNTFKVIKELVNEKKAIQEKSNAEVFSPLKDYRTVFVNIDDPEVSSKVDLVFDLLGNKIELSNQPEANKTKSNLEKFKQEVERSSNSADKTWDILVDEAQRFFNKETLNAVTTKNIKKLHSRNTKLSTEHSKTVLSAVEDKSLDTIEQREFIARYKNDKNFKTILGNSGINKKEAIDSLLSFEKDNKAMFKVMSHVFRENISPEQVKENKDLTNRYITALGKDPESMDDRRKFEVLSSIPKEQLELVSHKVSKDWKKGTLEKFMSEKFVEVELQHNINAQAMNITNALERVENHLDKISINTGKQCETLEKISNNFDDYVDLYKNTEAIKIDQLKGINENTLSIKANTRALLLNASNSTKDKELRAEILKLLPENEKGTLQNFYNTLDKKAKEEKDAKRKQQWMTLGKLVVGGALAVGAVAAGPAILGSVGLGSATEIGKSLSSVGSSFGTYYKVNRLLKMSKK